MAVRKSQEFDLNGAHYKSVNQCVRLTGKSIPYIKKYRKNVKIVETKVDHVITPSLRNNKEEKTERKQKAMEARIAVEDYLQDRALNNNYFDNWCDGLEG